MPPADACPRPVTRKDPAWFDCGDLASPDYGRLFVQPVARGALAYWFDRAQRRFAMTCRRGPWLGETAELHGRAFTVADWTDPAKAEAAAMAAQARRPPELR